MTTVTVRATKLRCTYATTRQRIPGVPCRPTHSKGLGFPLSAQLSQRSRFFLTKRASHVPLEVTMPTPIIVELTRRRDYGPLPLFLFRLLLR